MAVGQVGEEYAEAQREMQECFPCGCEPPGVFPSEWWIATQGGKIKLHATWGASLVFHFSWQTSVIEHSKSRHQGFHRGASVHKWGWAWGPPSYLSTEEHMCVSPHGTPVAYHWTKTQVYLLIATSEAPCDLGQASLLDLISFLPPLAHTVQVHRPVLPVSRMWHYFSFFRMCWGWIGPQNTLCLNVARAGSLLFSPSTGFRSFLATISDVTLPLHPSHFLILVSSQHFIPLFICSLFLVSFPILNESLMKSEKLSISSITIFSTQ